ncbi:phage GP46 family protein [Paraburkholderia terrae]|uniref:phage GP46 family protein n=1 Tax=Paraburkholderia terrae TaxID=311230 RepID=UPI00296AE7F6|nr:phage GP46 family protein [Paraburkholderia terrae]MDW3655476.1 phage GP46 family protein [Paraburkholderia terrae]
MSDTSTVWDTANSRGDWVLAGAQLLTGNDLETAYLISLFTDRQAQPGDVIPDGSNDTRGWIGDVGQKYPIGSRLWLLERAKATPQTLNNARTYVTEAVQWLVDDKVVSKHDITVQWIASGQLGIWIQAYRPDGSKFPAFSWVWKGIK